MKTLRDLIKEIKQIKGIFSLASLIYLLGMLSNQLAPLHLKNLVDSQLKPLSEGQPFDQAALLEGLGAYLLLLVVAAGLGYLASRLLNHCSNKVIENLRNRAYAVMQALPIAYFDDKPAGKIATRIVNDTETLRTEFYDNLVFVAFNLLKLVLTYGIIFWVNPAVGFALLPLLPIFYGIQFVYKKLTDKPVKDYFEARSQVNSQVNEVMNGIGIIQVFGQQDTALAEFEETIGQMRLAEIKQMKANSLAGWPLTEFFRNAVVALVLALVGYQFVAGQSNLSVGQLFLYLNYLLDLFDIMGLLTRRYPNIQRSLETGRKVFTLLQEEVEVDKADQLVVDQGRVIFEQVAFAYEDGKATLTDINLTAEPGQTIALVGHTGSGKSSMMNLLYRFYDPKAGQICIDGQDISQFSRESLRSHMGIVLQDPYLFTGTIASNVSMNWEGARDEDIRVALEKVGAGPMLARLEKGIHEPVVEKGAAFSSGERQLIAFARTLFANPKLLILDEATSHIDTETEELIQRAMAVLKEGRTTFIIAHRLSTIQHADQILVLDQGRIVERGTHDQLLVQGGIYAHMHQIQQTV